MQGAEAPAEAPVSIGSGPEARKVPRSSDSARSRPARGHLRGIHRRGGPRGRSARRNPSSPRRCRASKRAGRRPAHRRAIGSGRSARLSDRGGTGSASPRQRWMAKSTGTWDNHGHAHSDGGGVISVPEAPTPAPSRSSAPKTRSKSCRNGTSGAGGITRFKKSSSATRSC